MNTISVGGALSFAWEAFKKRPWVLVGATLVIFVVNMLVGAFVDMLGEDGILALVGVVVNLAAGALIGMGTTAFYLKAHDSIESAQIQDLWHPKDFWKYLGATLLQGLAMVIVFLPFAIALLITLGAAFFSSPTDFSSFVANVGVISVIIFIACVAAALYVSAALMFGAYAVVDRALGPITALKESMRITKDHRLQIIGFLVVAIVINIAGAILLFVGLLVSVPLTLLGIVHIYRSLSGTAAPAPVSAPAQM